MALTIESYTGTIKSDEQMLAEIQAAIRAIIAGGQSYDIAGSRSVTRADLPELERMERKYLRRVLLAKGWDGRTRPDLSDETSGDSDDAPSH